MKFSNFSIDKSGIWFDYYGDIVLYKYPWSRKGHKYVSVLSEGGFNSLKELRKFWDEYYVASKDKDGSLSIDDFCEQPHVTFEELLEILENVKK